MRFSCAQTKKIIIKLNLNFFFFVAKKKKKRSAYHQHQLIQTHREEKKCIFFLLLFHRSTETSTVRFDLKTAICCLLKQFIAAVSGEHAKEISK